MQDEYSLLSPEKVYFSFDLAGFGSRAVAMIIDSIIQYLLLFFVIALFLFTANVADIDFITLMLDNWIFLVVLILAIFVIFYGYFIFFELIWSGQTPGKKFAKIRVVKDNGGAVTLSSILIRNTLRVIDAVPSYGIGLIVLLITKKNQRLGDLAAGTIVIREKGYDLPQTLEFEAKEYPWSGSLKLKIHKVTEEEYAALKSFLLRYPTMDKQGAEITLNKLKDFFAAKLEIPEAEIPEPIQFLQQIAAYYLQK